MFGFGIRSCGYPECRRKMFFLAFHLLAGYACGTVFTLCCYNGYGIVKGALEISRISVFAFCVSSLMPLLISFLAWAFLMQPVIYILALLDSLLFAAVATMLIASFPVAGWLISVFLLFSESWIMLLQVLFWRSCLVLNRHAVVGRFFLYCLLTVIVVNIDYYFISPIFLALFT